MQQEKVGGTLQGSSGRLAVMRSTGPHQDELTIRGDSFAKLAVLAWVVQPYSASSDFIEKGICFSDSLIPKPRAEGSDRECTFGCIWCWQCSGDALLYLRTPEQALARTDRCANHRQTQTRTRTAKKPSTDPKRHRNQHNSMQASRQRQSDRETESERERERDERKAERIIDHVCTLPFA